jgi:hypothetical protein
VEPRNGQVAQPSRSRGEVHGVFRETPRVPDGLHRTFARARSSAVNSAALTRPKARAPRQATRSSPRIREKLKPRE